MASKSALEYIQAIGIPLIVVIVGYSSFATHAVDKEVEHERRIMKLENQVESVKRKITEVQLNSTEAANDNRVILTRIEAEVKGIHNDIQEMKQRE